LFLFGVVVIVGNDNVGANKVNNLLSAPAMAKEERGHYDTRDT
jgi:hypothetical protein